MAVQIWPEPNLLGSRFPDFVVRRSDNTYVVVEIECPSKNIVTAAGQLSADTTHAEQQAVDYRTYLLRRINDARAHFPGFDNPDCLVVIGKEQGLTDRQREVLRDANLTRHKLRIVGFDWLAERAKVVAANITRHDVEVTQLRVT